MKFSIGDKVKFLNSSGGGIVTKIISPSMVNIAIEDGFDIPTLTSEIIKMDESSSSAIMFSQNYNISHIEPVTAKTDNEDSKSGLIKSYTNNSHPAGIYLAFIPHDQKWLITGDIDIYLINHSEFYTLFNFTLFGNNSKYFGMDFDVLEPESKKLITTIEREELEEWCNGNIQILFHAEEKDKMLLPLNADYKIKAIRFYKEENYISSSFISEKSLILTIGKLIENPVHSKVSLIKKDDNKIIDLQTKKAVQSKENNILDKHLTDDKTAEIDLHIGELVEDYYLLENAEMLRIQLDYFSKCLNQAYINKIPKLIFIHGVGNGVLKSEIIKVLKTYDNLHYFDASMAKYGVGATEVYINHNK